MDNAQPALLYIVPGTLIPVALLALARGELKDFWDGDGSISLDGDDAEEDEDEEEEAEEAASGEEGAEETVRAKRDSMQN